MENKQSPAAKVSPATAVVLGALAPGVNVRSTLLMLLEILSYMLPIQVLIFLLFGFQGATWNTLKSTFVMLGLCLAVMLGLTFSSGDSLLMLHVAFLLVIAVSLFLLINW